MDHQLPLTPASSRFWSLLPLSTGSCECYQAPASIGTKYPGWGIGAHQMLTRERRQAIDL